MEWSGQPEQSSTPATAESEPICPIPHKDHALETAGGNPSVFTSTRFSTLTMRVQIFVTCGHGPAERDGALAGCRRLAGSAASRSGSADSRGAREPARSTRCPVRRHLLGSSAHCERPCRASRLPMLIVESSVCDEQLWLHMGLPVAERALDETSAKKPASDS